LNKNLQIFLIICLVFFLITIFSFIVKKRIDLKYSLVWLLADIVMLVVTIFPQIVDIIGAFIGIASPVNTIFLFGGMFIILIILTLTFIVSHMNNRIYKMVQSIALLEKRIRELENKEVLIIKTKKKFSI